MSDDHDHEPFESPLPPADDERIRRLLAEARHTEPIPGDVADRLDRVLGDLTAGRAGSDAAGVPAPVVDLAARRRRTAAGLLVAAAAVVAVGFGITQVLPHGVGGSDDSPTAATAGDAAAGGSADSEGGSSSRNGVPGPEAASPSAGGGVDAKALPVRSASFGRDVRRLRRQVLLDGHAAADYAAPACLTADVGAGKELAATYDGAPAVLVLRAPSGEVQVVDLYLCGDTEPRRSITLTAP